MEKTCQQYYFNEMLARAHLVLVIEAVVLVDHLVKHRLARLVSTSLGLLEQLGRETFLVSLALLLVLLAWLDFLFLHRKIRFELLKLLAEVLSILLAVSLIIIVPGNVANVDVVVPSRLELVVLQSSRASAIPVSQTSARIARLTSTPS